MIKRTLIVTAMMCVALTATGQWWRMPMAFDTVDTARTAVHLSVGSMVQTGLGGSDAVGWVAPSFRVRANERLTLRGGFVAAGSMMPGGYVLQGRGVRNMVPVREGTQLGAAWVAAEYRASERLLLWGAASHVGGFAQPLWAQRALPVDATAVSGGLAYRFSHNSVLAMHFHFVHDEYGYLLHPPYGHGYYGPLAPDLELFSAPWPY